MSFLAPIFLAGLAAVVVPILVHLLGRPRARTWAFAAMQFVLASRHDTAPRLVLREALLLLLRVLAVAAAVLVLAKPVVRLRGSLPVGPGVQSLVIVLDDSLSMRSKIGGETLMDRARERAEELVDTVGPAAEVALVLAREGGVAPVPELSRDLARVRRAIRDARATTHATDVPGAVAQGARILQGASTANRSVVVITDGTAAAFPAASPRVAGGPAVRFIDVSGGTALVNRALAGVDVEPAPDVGPHAVQVTATVAASGPGSGGRVPIAVEIDDRVRARGTVDVPAGGTAQKRFHLDLPAGGLVAGAVRIEGRDALADDDVRPLAAEVRRDVRVLIVDGDVRPLRRDDEAFYLETALRPSGGSAIVTTTVAADDLPSPLPAADVVFLCNVKAPTAKQAAALEELVRGGGGLFVSVGDNVDVEATNAALGRLLPARLASARAASSHEAGWRLAPIDDPHPVLAPFADVRGEGLGSARFWKTFLLQPGPSAGNDRHVLLRYDDDAPALVEFRPDGAPLEGHVLLWTSSIDRDWNDLAIRPGYLPLVQQAARWLGGASLRPAPPPSRVGDARLIPVMPEWRALRVLRPGGATSDFDLAADAARGPVTLPGTAIERPGLYRVQSRAEGAWRDTAQSFVATLDPRESDLTRAKDAELRGTDVGIEGTPVRRVPAWPSVAAVLVALLVVEGALGRRA